MIYKISSILSNVRTVMYTHKERENDKHDNVGTTIKIF